jgi:hypothetical protein
MSLEVGLSDRTREKRVQNEACREKKGVTAGDLWTLQGIPVTEH